MGSGTDVIIAMWEGVACAYHCAVATNGHQPNLWTLLKPRLASPPASDATAPVYPICDVRVC